MSRILFAPPLVVLDRNIQSGTGTSRRCLRLKYIEAVGTPRLSNCHCLVTAFRKKLDSVYPVAMADLRVFMDFAGDVLWILRLCQGCGWPVSLLREGLIGMLPAEILPAAHGLSAREPGGPWRGPVPQGPVWVCPLAGGRLERKARCLPALAGGHEPDKFDAGFSRDSVQLSLIARTTLRQSRPGSRRRRSGG